MNPPSAETAALASKYTPAFNELLKKAGASLLVSTYQAGRLILLRAGETLNTHFVSMPKPMGIALSGPRLSVGTGHQVWDYFNMPAVAPKVLPAGSHDACFIPRRLHITGDIDIHEMAFDRDNELWILNTRMSALCTLNLEHSVVPRWRPPFISAYDLTDRCHLNGLAIKNGRPAWATALGSTDTPTGWRKDKASGGILMDIRKNRIIAKGLSMPHSPRWYEKKLYVLESGAGRISSVNPQNGVVTPLAEMPGFCRGISFIGPYALIGLSQVRETAVFAGLPLTMRCQERMCGIWIVDLRDGSIPGWLAFESGVQEIFAVQVLPWKFPAILDMGDPLVKTSYSIPDDALKDVAETDPLEAEIGAATLLRREGKLDEAAEAFRDIIEKAPDNSRAMYMLGDTLACLGRYEEAVDVLDRFLEKEPKNADACLTAANCLKNDSKWETAINYYKKALASDNAFAAAHHGMGEILMRLGKYQEGWQEYKWRRELADFACFHSSKTPWKGTALGPKKLLVSAEQCLSDAILLARFLPDAAKLCSRLIVAAPEPLRALLGAVDGVYRAKLPQQLNDKEFNEYASVLDLMDLADISIAFPPETSNVIPYLKVPAGTPEPVMPNKGRLKTGILWSDNRYPQRSCPVEEFKDLTEIKKTDWFSLQPMPSEEENALLEELDVADMGNGISTFAGMAAIINRLDLFITVDSAAAHIAGALGKECWVILTGNDHWCWPAAGDSSPWYPTVRIFRKTSSDGWEAAIGKVKNALSERLGITRENQI